MEIQPPRRPSNGEPLQVVYEYLPYNNQLQESHITMENSDPENAGGGGDLEEQVSYRCSLGQCEHV